MFSREHRISITTRLLGYLLLAGLVPLVLLGISSFDISRRVIIEQAGQFHLQQVSDLRAYLDLYADQIESLAANVAGNEAVGEALRAPRPSGKDTADSFATLSAHAQIGYILNSYVRIKGLVSLDLFSLDGRHFHVGDTLEVSDVDQDRVRTMLTEMHQSGGGAYWRGIEDNLNRASTKKRVLSVTRAIRYYVPETGQSEVVGLLVINIEAKIVLEEFLNSVSAPERLNLMLLDAGGRFVYQRDQNLIGEPATPDFLALIRSEAVIQELRLDGEDVVLAKLPATRMGGYLVVAQPRHVLTRPINVLIYAGLVLLLIGSVAIALLTMRFSRQVVQPIREVSEGFRVLQEQPNKPPPQLSIPSAHDELGDMVVGFNRHLELLADQQRATRDLIVAQHAAEAANLAKSRFLATMSHEIRTPMNGILGMAQLLLSDNVKAAERQDFARTILNSGQTLLTLLNDILDLSKVESGKMSLENVPFQPSQLLHETEALFQEGAHQKQLSFTVTWLGDPYARYIGDPYRLRQMLSNLISNAIKFTKHGKIEITGQEVSRVENAALIEFSVVDSGIGIPKDKQALLFKPFSQVDSSTTREFGGSGLGLSIVRSLVQLMGGDVGVESVVGQGARFWFRVQVDCLSGGADTRGRDRQSPVSGSSQATTTHDAMLSGHILVVEDNATNRKVIAALLVKLGVTVSTANDGLQGVTAAKQDGPFDMVLMDIQMPLMDGLIATREIRRWEQESDKRPLPIIALTAGAFEEDRSHAEEAGMNDFLTKPVTLQELRRVASKWLPER